MRTSTATAHPVRSKGEKLTAPDAHLNAEKATAFEPPAVPTKLELKASWLAAYPIIEWLILWFNVAAYLLLLLMPMLHTLFGITSLLNDGIIPLMGLVFVVMSWFCYRRKWKASMWWMVFMNLILIGWEF